MSKHVFLLIISVLLSNAAICQTADTTILFFKVIDGVTASVPSLDGADYFRLVLPPDSGDNRHNIKEFYKSGKLKRIGKAYAGPGAFNATSGVIQFDGDCMSFYSNGRKSSIVHYKEGFKEGLEYEFFPTGKVYCCVKHIWKSRLVPDEALNWECYDENGKQICTEGNGRWIVYSNNFMSINSEGSVVQGYVDGEWHGNIASPDTIKYTYLYKKGTVVSGIGYDKQGNAYPFQYEVEKAHYKSRGLTFIEVLRSHIKLPRDTNGKKMSMDTMHVSFVVEKDGHLSNYHVLGEVSQTLKDAIFVGLDKINGWTPQKRFGIPYRTEITFPLNEVSGFSGNYYVKHVDWKEKIIKDN